VLLLFSGCATIISSAKYPVTIESEPQQATVTVIDRKGRTVFEGETPAEVKLKAGAGYFKAAEYDLQLEKEGYDPAQTTIKSSLDFWYMGNLFFLGFLGLLVIDPLTGAMYQLEDEKVSITLSPAGLQSDEDKK
jgi:hypothetical protein